jgi:hypothetical protein
MLAAQAMMAIELSQLLAGCPNVFKVFARQDGSMLPLFIVFLMIVLWLVASATNLTGITLQRQRLQAQADQKVLTVHANGSFLPNQTSEIAMCEKFELPIKLIGLPTTHEICVRSAAR